MKVKIPKDYLIIILSAVVSAFAYMQMYIFVLLFSWSLLFYILLKNQSDKKAIKYGFVFGLFYGVTLFMWIFDSLKEYSSKAYLGIFVIIALAFIYGLQYALFSYLFNRLNTLLSKTNLYLRILSLACLLTLLDEFFSFLYTGIPFLNLRVGFTLSYNLYLVQFAKIGGVAILSFMVFLINALISNFILTKKRFDLIVVFACIITIFLFGFILYSPILKKQKLFKVSVVSANINPKISWDAENGNQLAQNYFSVCESASNQNPVFIVFPESAIPWLYTEKDDFVSELLKINKNNKTTLVIGANKIVSKSELANSVLFISKNEGNYASYSKNVMLEAFEKPLLNFFQLPFYANADLKYSKTGTPEPILTKYGNAGVLICNESTEENFVKEQVQNHANYFFVLSNDGWFKDTYISLYHFYISRIMAVAHNKDFAKSSNCGFNGIIKSNGAILDVKKSSEPVSITNFIASNSTATFYSSNPYLFLTFILLTIILSKLTTFKFKLS